MLFDLLTKQLGGENLTRVSRQLGTDEKTAGSAISAALPLLIGALAKNARSTQGAESLNNAVRRDHDGSILDNLSDFVSNPRSGDGEGILRHVLGGGRSTVENALSQTTGLGNDSVGQLLTMLAPVLMGGLGKVQRERNLQAEDMAGMLQHESNRVRKSSPAGGLMSLLDSDGDGSVVDDVAGMLGKLF